MEPIELGHLSHFWTVTAVVVTGFVAMLAMVSVGILWGSYYRRQAALARATEEGISELEEGPALVQGLVEYAEGAEEAVVVEITEKAKVSKGQVVQSWNEIDRQQRSTPFYLRTESGERIRVEPDSQAVLIDDLEKKAAVDPEDKYLRRRIATLSKGEKVIAKGHLRRDFDKEARPQAYRDASLGWVLGRSRGEPLFLSSKPLAARFERRQRFHFRAARILGVLFVLIQLANMADLARIFLGETKIAKISDVGFRFERDKEGDLYPKYHIEARTKDGWVHRADVFKEDYLRRKQGHEIPLRHWRGKYQQFSERGTLHAAYAILLFVVVGLAGLCYRSFAKFRPWYDRKAGGSGGRGK